LSHFSHAFSSEGRKKKRERKPVKIFHPCWGLLAMAAEKGKKKRGKKGMGKETRPEIKYPISANGNGEKGKEKEKEKKKATGTRVKEGTAVSFFLPLLSDFSSPATKRGKKGEKERGEGDNERRFSKKLSI